MALNYQIKYLESSAEKTSDTAFYRFRDKLEHDIFKFDMDEPELPPENKLPRCFDYKAQSKKDLYQFCLEMHTLMHTLMPFM